MTKQEKLKCCEKMIAVYEENTRTIDGICIVFTREYSDLSMRHDFHELFNEIFTNLLPVIRKTTGYKTTMYAFPFGDTESRIEFLKTFKKQFE